MLWERAMEPRFRQVTGSSVRPLRQGNGVLIFVRFNI